ncbi:MAG: FAD-dependent oxidoreductase [Chloroflexi bacterium]|nr:FAD-dependent oxidoreductase [Chloroflexota bacterium]
MLATNRTKWDKTADVVVIGYGLAGAVTAIAARDLGASAIILEKQAAAGHVSASSISGGLWICPTEVNGAIKHMEALAKAGQSGMRWTDADILRVWAEKASQNTEWIKSLGGNAKLEEEPAEYTHLPGAETIRRWRYNGCGLRLMELMKEQARKRKVEVLYQTPASRLLTNANGEVIGVKATVVSGPRPRVVNIRAAKAVVLCSGGFEENDEMKLQYLRTYPLYFAGCAGNTGDGILMAQEVGADLWHMNCCSARLCAKFPDFPYAFLIRFGGQAKDGKPCGYVVVDRHGNRYLNENIKGHAAWYEMTRFDTHKLEYTFVPSYHIFDQRRMAASRLTQLTSGPSGPHQLYKWSADNTEELKRGWIVSGKTLRELGRELGMSGVTLEKTVKDWNKLCAKGNDTEFGRDPKDMAPIDNPPYYAIKLFPGGPNTQGGPRRNARAQVLDPFGQPIRGLYAAGECGSVYGMLYPGGGGNLAECIAFGRIAAENAVKEKGRA